MDPAVPAGVDGRASAALLKLGRFFTRWEESEDGRVVFRQGGRAGDVFYRDRWSHDKVVRSTHGVNCTGSCSWKIYVRDGIITWEAQQTDYPSVGPDRPEYEPRGCPRGAAFSWYTYSPTRVRYPYARGVLLEMYREAKQRLKDPVLAWADVVDDPERRRRYHQARGKGGLVRVSWAEAVEMIAAAQVHTIKTYGPDRISAFSPIPAMSMVSHCVGTRFTQLIGGVMTSFYDWYADLPVASPQVFGDQTDVPESGDWWDATYLMMWGSNVPVTRTPDAHWMAEVRYRGTKIVTVSPDYADNTKFADEWLPAQAGTDAALAMAMGHVILKEFFLDRQVPFFTDFVKTYTDLPFLITLTENAQHGGLVPGKFLTEADLDRGSDGEKTDGVQPEAAWKTVLLDTTSGEPVVPNGSMGFRYADSGIGHWNLDLADVTPALSIRDVDANAEVAEVLLPCFEAPDGSGSVLHRGVPVRRIGDRVVTTVFDLMLAHYGVARVDLPGDWPTGYNDSNSPYTPAWQAEITSV
ncbi:MAG TPA: molybdopterin-dependent oxidoreductase, partial [Propionibacteriaceae bacterium]|nr:molybdopterin-dependent oxidoreductase [Propionibacteriaceae bacterium]